jgi:hypothetical protein
MTRPGRISSPMPQSAGKDQGNEFTDSAFGAAVRASAGGRKELISPEEFLRVELQSGISADNPEFGALGRTTAAQMLGRGFRSVLDFGAGTGVYADAFHRAGFDVQAFEIWEAHRAYIREKFPHIRLVEAPVTTDLMLFIETAEHMTDDELRTLFSQIRPDYVLFSSTSARAEWDVEWGHINVKPPSEWVTFFESLGYVSAGDLAAPTPWSRLFRRKQAPLRLRMLERWRRWFPVRT